MLEKLKLYINVEKITVSQRRNNVSLSTLNQRRNLMLKQRWFWVDSKKQICFYNMIPEKSKSLYNVEMMTILQRRNNVSLSTLNQRRNWMLKQRWFLVDHKNIFVLMFYSNFDWGIIDVILMHIFDSPCFFWCVFKRKKIVVVLSLIDKFSIFQKWESLGRVFSM